MNVFLPQQDVSDSAKRKEKWFVPTYDYWIYQCTTAKNNNQTQILIDASNGIIDKSVLNYLLKPFNEQAEELNEKFPIKLKSTDIITPIVEKIIGEYIELPYNYSVKFHDPDIATAQDSEIRQLMADVIKASIIEELRKAQSENSSEDITPVQLKALIEKKKEEYIFNETLKAKRYLQYVNEKTDFDYYRYQMYYNWWTTEETYTYRTIENGEFIKKIILPQEGFPYLGDCDFVEDGIAFLWVEDITWDEFLMKEKDKLTKEQRNYVEALMGSVSTNSPIYAPPHLIESRRYNDWYRIGETDRVGKYLTESSRTIRKHNIVFKAYRKVKELRYVDLSTNKEKITIVPDDYNLNTSLGDIEIKNRQIPEVYYGARYGYEHTGVYTKPEKLLVQRDGKLPVTGKIGILKNKKINPVPFRLVAYQLIDMMLTFHIEKTLHKYKDDILIIPKSMLASDKGASTTEKTYYLLKDGRIVYDDSIVNLQTVVQGFRLVQGSSTDKYLNTLIQIQQYFASRAQETGSLNNDRLGNIDTRSGVGNVEQNIYRSKLGNALSLEVFRKILEKEHEADLEYAKYIFIDGISDTMFDEKGKVIQIDIDGYINFKRSYGVYIDNGLNLDNKLNQIRQMAVSAAQNGDFDQGISAIESDNIEEIKLAVKMIKKANEEQQQALEQSRLQQQELANQGALELEDKRINNEQLMEELKGSLEQENLVIGKEYDLIMNRENNEIKERASEIDAQTAREGIISREKIQQIKSNYDKEKEEIKAKYSNSKVKQKDNK